MKSDVYNQSNNIEDILAEAELFGRSCELTPPEANKLRLLAEEILGLTVRLFDDLRYEFFIENSKQRFTLTLRAATLVDPDQKEKVISLSSRGKNKSLGILGKISEVFENLVTGEAGAYPFGGSFESHYGGENPDTLFSLKYYQKNAPEEEKKPEWDGLEKSILAHFADDVTISASSNKVVVVATITI